MIFFDVDIDTLRCAYAPDYASILHRIMPLMPYDIAVITPPASSCRYLFITIDYALHMTLFYIYAITYFFAAAATPPLRYATDTSLLTLFITILILPIFADCTADDIRCCRRHFYAFFLY